MPWRALQMFDLPHRFYHQLPMLGSPGHLRLCIANQWASHACMTSTHPKYSNESVDAHNICRWQEMLLLWQHILISINLSSATMCRSTDLAQFQRRAPKFRILDNVLKQRQPLKQGNCTAKIHAAPSINQNQVLSHRQPSGKHSMYGNSVYASLPNCNF